MSRHRGPVCCVLLSLLVAGIAAQDAAAVKGDVTPHAAAASAHHRKELEPYLNTKLPSAAAVEENHTSGSAAAGAAPGSSNSDVKQPAGSKDTPMPLASRPSYKTKLEHKGGSDLADFVRYHDSDDPHSGSYYTEGKEHEHHSGEYYAGDAAGYGYAPDFSSPPCIEECTEYAEAFNIGEVARCVDDNILVRLDGHFVDPENYNKSAFQPAPTKDLMFQNFLDARKKAVTFWSYGDNPEKYIRIGRDQLTLGNYVDNPPTPPFAGLQAANFPGLQSASNFAALLEQIGYDSSSTKPRRTYMMVVTKKPHNKEVSKFIPTWDNIGKYFSYYVSRLAAKDSSAVEAAGIKDTKPYRHFEIEPSTCKILRTHSFANLTGCPAQCTVQDTTFGDVNTTPGGFATWNAPTRGVPRIDAAACNLTDFPTPRWEVTEPTSIESASTLCETTWQKFYQDFNVGVCNPPATNVTENRAQALKMAKAYMAASSDMEKAIIFRAYLLSRCSGTFNELFSGDGFTWSGNGGFLQPTGTEFLNGEVLPQDIPETYPSIRLVFFCPAAPDGSLNQYALCPPELGELNVTKFREEYGAKHWDIREVKHPSLVLDEMPDYSYGGKSKDQKHFFGGKRDYYSKREEYYEQP